MTTEIKYKFINVVDFYRYQQSDIVHHGKQLCKLSIIFKINDTTNL